ncbi:hypothetical protein BDV98DRAFT_163136 [Pterulicium gracile]|uniref:Uncharacterized protein n=1 Tax=Pterulicium gracile TaxID=1884261 RepID=A0A5C3R0W5_9AGAR|nr:hypothetical protein BDV98DRAFT_163136 [Pterula gracilis]
MSNIQRSKSTPHVQNALSSAGVPRSFSHTALSQHFVARTQSRPSVWSSNGSHHHYCTQKTRPEDPFNLGGFFPAFPNEGLRDDTWTWLRPDEEDEGDLTDEEPEQLVSDQDMKLAMEEALQQGERNSVLSGLYATSAGSAATSVREQMGPLIVEDTARVRLLSPYSHDGVVDDQSLYDHLRELRAKEQEMTAKAAPQTTKPRAQKQSLFFEDDDQIWNMYKSKVF